MSKMGEFHFEELKQYRDTLKQLDREFPGFIEECIRELAARLLAKTIARTPVDTGDLRNGWTIGPIQREGDDYLVEIINPVEYAMYVEYGHRTRNHMGWVEGRFMLTISQEELEAEMPAFLEQKIQQFMNRLGG
ncbi:hypothetical protein ABH14_10015 [Brevibacillus brevis]|uniref:HK97 gp10 family phage protein n=1 Tax=Brevibacillus brevis TaxID=1393 RepID=UPI001900E7F0|nr:HK97 gp10 family phage protein [Brevibacillus brevis]MBH0330125.1 hypothetical protein [Brevibacillus brevis]